MNKAGLSRQGRWLVEQCQLINFGLVTFHVRDGEADVTRSWHTKRTVKLACGENGPRPEASLADFELSLEQSALLRSLHGIRDGARVTVEVRHGLPFLLEIEQEHLIV